MRGGDGVVGGAFVEGDLMWKLIVSGRVDMTPDPESEAVRQLQLRYRNGALLVDSLVSAGFTAVHVDIVLGHTEDHRCWPRLQTNVLG
ncbi:MAG: hypothetical protein ACOYEP_09165 [Limnochordia bacterium]